MPNGTEHPFPGAENPFSGIHSFLQALAAEGKAPGEQLREVRANLPSLTRGKPGGSRIWRPGSTGRSPLCHSRPSGRGSWSGMWSGRLRETMPSGRSFTD